MHQLFRVPFIPGSKYVPPSSPLSLSSIMEIAGKLINPAFAAGGELPEVSAPASHNSPAKRAEKLFTATLSALKRDGSEMSLSSILSQDGEDQMRICRECKGLLDRRDEQMEQRAQSPHLVQMYERLRSLIADAAAVFPSYCLMAESLKYGIEIYCSFLPSFEGLVRILSGNV